ncbi:MAG TPA: hypothetical protein VK828_15740 [Terriglobales bacterium]|jgi:hypothetical protein|nr:hypothetical protein [Terriglobales bacterium]
MKISKIYIAIGLVIALSLFLELFAHADEFDQATTITFSQAIQIPGQVLPAGTYLFRLADASANENIVQIFSPDRTVLYATVRTIPTTRQKPTGDTVVSVAEPETGQPDALLKWFYPGREVGVEFVYPKQQEKKLAQDRRQIVVAGQATRSNTDDETVGN